MLTDRIGEQEIRNILEEILKRREFHSAGKKNPIAELMNNIWEAILEWARQILQYRQPNREFRINSDLIGNSALQTILRVLLILIAAVLLFLVLGLIAKRLYIAGKIKKSQIPKVYDYLDRPEEVMEKYNEYMSSKEYSKALRFLFIALLLELGRREIIKIEKWKTNRMYIREIGLRDKALVLPMQEFSSLFNECCYRNRPVDEISVSKWFEFYTSQKEKPV